MSYIDHSNVIDGNTGETLSKDAASDNPHAVLSKSYIYATNFLRELEGLPRGARLSIDSYTDLTPLRLDRAEEQGHERIYSFKEIKAALRHPHVSREGIVDRTEPPERGQALAVYNAVTQWIEYVESEWQHLAPGETMSGSADETLDPILLDLCNETYITAPRQIYDWLRGEIKAIPASVAHRANQIVTAAYQSWTHAMAWTLRDQLHAIAEREGVQHVWTTVPQTIEPNALQCAYAITDTWFPIGGARSLWRPCVNPDSSSEEVKIKLRGSECGIRPIKITIDRRTVSLDIEGERTTFDHEGTEQGTTQASRLTSEGLEAHIREVHLGRSARERDATFREMYGRPISEAGREADVTHED